MDSELDVVDDDHDDHEAKDKELQLMKKQALSLIVATLPLKWPTNARMSKMTKLTDTSVEEFELLDYKEEQIELLRYL
jgi:hypothetical protein